MTRFEIKYQKPDWKELAYIDNLSRIEYNTIASVLDTINTEIELDFSRDCLLIDGMYSYFKEMLNVSEEQFSYSIEMQSLPTLSYKAFRYMISEILKQLDIKEE